MIILLRCLGWLSVAAIIVLSVLPGSDRPHSGISGQLEHVIAYAVSAALLGLAYPESRARLTAWAFLCVLSAALESLQLWIPGRTSELIGFSASSLGATLGMLAAIYGLRGAPLRRSLESRNVR
jgi:VanZ family protein